MAVDDSDALRRARLFVDGQAQSTPEQFDALALRGLRVVAASKGRCLCEFTCDAGKLNRFRTLHGGCISTLVDIIGSAGIITVSNLGGVTLALHTIMLQPGRENEQILVEARTLKVGKQIATVEVELRSKRDDGSPGHLIAKGTHVKALVPHSDLSALFVRELEPASEQSEQPIAGGSRAPLQQPPPRSRL